MQIGRDPVGVGERSCTLAIRAEYRESETVIPHRVLCFLDDLINILGYCKEDKYSRGPVRFADAKTSRFAVL